MKVILLWYALQAAPVCVVDYDTELTLDANILDLEVGIEKCHF